MPPVLTSSPEPILTVCANGDLVFRTLGGRDELVERFPTPSAAIEAWKAAKDAARRLNVMMGVG